MFVPKPPQLKGKIQIRLDKGETVLYKNVGDISLWNHEGQFVLRGNIEVEGKRYLVSLEQFQTNTEEA